MSPFQWRSLPKSVQCFNNQTVRSYVSNRIKAHSLYSARVPAILLEDFSGADNTPFYPSCANVTRSEKVKELSLFSGRGGGLPGTRLPSFCHVGDEPNCLQSIHACRIFENNSWDRKSPSGTDKD